MYSMVVIEVLVWENKLGIVTQVTYCCSKEGHRKYDKRREKVSYSQPISRVGCEAHMTCLLKKEEESFKVTLFKGTHNHALIRTPMKHMLRNNRCTSKAKKAHDDDAEKSGIPIKATMELMSREVGGWENLGFLDKDY